MIGFVVAYFAIPTDTYIALGPIGVVQLSNLVLGLTFGLAVLLIGVGAIQWAKKLMADEEIVDERHPLGSPKEDQDAALAAFQTGLAESGFVERGIVRRSLLGALLLFPIPLVVLLKDMGPPPGDSLRHTIWRKGSRIVVDVTGQPLRPEGHGHRHAGVGIPRGPRPGPGGRGQPQRPRQGLDHPRAHAAQRDQEPAGTDRPDWDYEGILAFSKICTHVGCPIALYQQRQHALLCPCHQSTFDLSDSGKVIFGPANRHMPQLPITIDSDGYLVAQSDFQEPVGPSFWERG